MRKCEFDVNKNYSTTIQVTKYALEIITRISEYLYLREVTGCGSLIRVKNLSSCVSVCVLPWELGGMAAALNFSSGFLPQIN